MIKHFLCLFSVEVPPHLPAQSLFMNCNIITTYVELSPPHTLHLSLTFPEFVLPSQPLHVELSPPHTPHLSLTFPEFGIPSQPYVELSPHILTFIFNFS